MENQPFLILKELFSILPDLNAAIRSHVWRNRKAAYEAMIRPETLCLHFGTTIQEIRWFLGHRSFYTNKRVSALSFLKPVLPSEELRFFDSPSFITHFANIKKLVIFNAPKDFYNFYDRIMPENKSTFFELEELSGTNARRLCNRDEKIFRGICLHNVKNMS